MKNLFFTIVACPYTYATILAIAAYLAAYTSEQKLKQIRRGHEILEESKNAVKINLEQTIEAKDEIIGMFTGGDSYPFIMFNDNGFLLASYGKYGIPNLRLQIVHIRDYENIPIESLSEYLNNQKVGGNISLVYTNTFTKTFAGTVDTIKFSDLEIGFDKDISHGFDFNFNSDFKRWTERVRLIHVDNKWEILVGLEEEVSHKENVHIMPKPRTIYFRASRNFPYLRTVDGKLIGSNQLYYHLTIERDNKLKYHNLFNRSFDLTEENRIIEPLDIDFFDANK